ncbi:MAG: GerMN domain-containing protein [Clostridiaceae bacterium]
MKIFKKPLWILTVLLVLLMSAVYTGCQNNNPNGNGKEYKISDYFPFTANLKTVYEGYGNEYASYTSYVDYIKGDKIQIRTNNGGTETARVYQNINGELVLLNTMGEIYYKQDITSAEPKQQDVALKEPLVAGTKWKLADGSTRSITGVDVNVTTPSGKYKALEVTTVGSNSTTKDYYVLNKGLVKTVWASGTFEVSSSLKEYVTDAAYDFTVRMYNFRVTQTDIETVYREMPISFKTNDEIKDTFQSTFRDGGLMTNNTKINSVYVKPEEGIAYVDFTQQFVTEMNAGTTKESGVLRSVTNTLGYYYQVDKVVITLDGGPYSSGHIYMNPGEYFETNYEGEVQVQ